LVYKAAYLHSKGERASVESSMAKLFASEMSERVCSAAMQTLGGYGYLRDFPIERICRDVRVAQIYEGTSDIQRLIISREIHAD
jgi:alkylation response protein AidB-like acyl-CoA dehydrogenase